MSPEQQAKWDELDKQMDALQGVQGPQAILQRQRLWNEQLKLEGTWKPPSNSAIISIGFSPQAPPPTKPQPGTTEPIEPSE